MYEDCPERDTPEEIRQDLRNYGGVSPDGQPIWRLVLAQNCRIHCFGTRHHVAKGRVAAIESDDDPHAKGRFEPDRIEDGEFWIPRYKHAGWILERWFPARTWGLREDWEGQKSRDGSTRLLAAYPQSGAYIMLCGPWTSIAAAGDLHAAIRYYNLQQRRNPVNWPNHLEAMAANEEHERQDLADVYADELSAKYREALAPVLATASAAADEFRGVVAKHTAQGVHLGASEKWGS